MDTPNPAPEEIRHLVGVRPGSITFPSTQRPFVWMLLGLLASAVLVGVTYLIALVPAAFLGLALGTEGLGLAVDLLVLGVPLAAGVMMVSVVGGFVRSMWPRQVTISGPTAIYDGPFPPSPVVLEGFVLRGVPGRQLELWSGETQLAKFVVTTRKRGWSYDSVTWLAEQCSTNAGLQLVDERPEADWRRWETDPVFRGEARFDARIQDNERDFPQHHATPPRAPKHTVDVEGMQIPVDTGLFSDTLVRIDGQHLRFSGRSYLLSDITRAGVAYRRRKTKNATHWRGRLTIVVAGRIKTVVQIGCSADGGIGAAHLNWMAAEIRRQVRLARPLRDRGSERDVPESMAAIVARESHAQEPAR